MSEKKIGDRVKELRDALSFSQATLATKADVSPAAISLIENNERIPSLIVTRKLAKALRVSMNELTNSEDKSTHDIDLEAQAFFRNFGDIDDLDPSDQEIIKVLAKKLKERK